jgi:hypothetical protein
MEVAAMGLSIVNQRAWYIVYQHWARQFNHLALPAVRNYNDHQAKAVPTSSATGAFREHIVAIPDSNRTNLNFWNGLDSGQSHFVVSAISHCSSAFLQYSG